MNIVVDSQLQNRADAFIPAPELEPSRKFPTWHFPMMNDHARNQGIYDSIDAIDLKDKIVFEIGTGAGLIAMYFAKRGAKHVYTCEMDKQLYDVAVQTVDANGLSDKVTVIHASSTDYIQSADFDFSPDVIFTETLDCGVVGEGYVNVAKDIAAIARPNTIVLPSEIRQLGFLVSSEEMAAQNSVGSGFDFDLSPINLFSTGSYFPVRYQMFASKALSEVANMRSYDYTETTPNGTTFRMTAYSAGVCHGILSYFHAQFGKSVVSNDPRDTGHWHQAFHPFPEPIQVTPGTTYTFVLNNDGSVSLLHG